MDVQPDSIFNELEKKGRNSVHFIGIGGIGLSALARWFLTEKWAVTGSDMEGSALTQELVKEGVRVVIGHKKEVPKGTILVIRSQAIHPDNPEYKAAQKIGARILTYPEMIGILTRRYKTMAVAGAHGKSTTTALLALIAIKGGLDPTVIIGTKLKEFGGSNFRKGKSDLLILEADEFGRAFLHYSPSMLLITNIDREHLDVYKGLADLKKTFMGLMRRVDSGGTLVLNGDNENLLALKPGINKLAKTNNLRVIWYSLNQRQAANKVKKYMKIPGRHNLSNGVGAHALARKLGIPETKIFAALNSYYGSWRRYEFKGKYKRSGVEYQIFDDYAHHPTEIKATLQAFRERFPRAVLVCVFQAHQAERLKRLFKDFKTAFKDADAVLFFPAYTVAGREEKPSPFTARALAIAVRRKYPERFVEYIPDAKKFSRKDVEAAMRGTSRKEAVIVMMGAGSIVNHTKQLL